MADPLRESFDPRDPPAPVPGGIAARARPGNRAAEAYLAGLNPEQRLAVETLDGPVLVLAGAGTGKTRVLTVRIAHILATGRARPSEILAVTFTNKAAREMKARVSEIVGHVVEGMPWLGTFHSIGVKILRRHAELVGLKNDFTILDVDDQVRLLKQLLAAENIDEKRWPARVLASLIDGWKNRGLTPEQVPPGEAGVFANGKGLKLYKAFQERLKILNAADFGDLLLENIRLFREHPEVLRQYQARFRFILVDEYQDTNVAQYLWLRLLAQRTSQLTGTNLTSPRARGEVGSRSDPGEGAAELPEPSGEAPSPALAVWNCSAPSPRKRGEGNWRRRRTNFKPFPSEQRHSAEKHLLRRRRRSVDLWLARRRGRQHPALRARLSRRHRDPAGTKLPLHRPHPRRRRAPDRPQRRPARQDAAHRRRAGRKSHASPAPGIPKKKPAPSARRSSNCSAAATR